MSDYAMEQARLQAKADSLRQVICATMREVTGELWIPHGDRHERGFGIIRASGKYPIHFYLSSHPKVAWSISVGTVKSALGETVEPGWYMERKEGVIGTPASPRFNTSVMEASKIAKKVVADIILPMDHVWPQMRQRMDDAIEKIATFEQTMEKLKSLNGCIGHGIDIHDKLRGWVDYEVWAGRKFTLRVYGGTVTFEFALSHDNPDLPDVLRMVLGAKMPEKD